MKHVATSLSLWILRWIEISLRGWARGFARLLEFAVGLLGTIPVSVHLFVLASFAVGLLATLPWFSYSLDLGGTETYEVTTNVWYLFLSPGALGLILSLLIRPWSYRIQLVTGSAALLLFLAGWIFPGLHSDMQSPPAPTMVYYAYPATLLAQAVLAFSLKHPDHGILTRIRARWKLKEAA